MTADIVARLVALLGEPAVIADHPGMEPFLSDWRGRYRGAARCVVKPATTEEVAATVSLLHRAGIAIVPQGGNTGLCGGATPDLSGDAVIISLSRLDRVRDIDTANNTVTAEAGCVLQQVQDAAERAGRLFPLSLAAQGSCEIGGNLSTNAGGVHVLRYGTMRELTLGLEVVLPDGRIWNGLRGLRKDNTGYDLKHLFIGAEGTLGVITAAVLKLFPRPRSTAVAWLALDTAAAAVELLGSLREAFGERITAFELVGAGALELVLKHIPASRPPLATTAPWSVLLEVGETIPGFDISGALETTLMEYIDAGRIRDAAIARSLGQAQDFWRLRENVSEAQKIEGISIKHDVSVPASRIPAFLEQADAALRKAFAGVRIVTFGHVGDGNLHYNLSQPNAMDNADFIAQTAVANRIVHDVVAALGGSISAEHGIGQLKRQELLRYKSDIEMELMRRVKTALDPRGLMNPGKIL
jgi:FAD/FMN-containing dehydrogenase